MKFFKKIDDYLLRYYPSIWVTRVHYFLPIGLGLIALIYLLNIAIGWNPKDDMPNSFTPILTMIIPVLVYLIYWFIFQSRYNVAKSGGKISYGGDYLNFFLYTTVFAVAYLFILVIPFSNTHKMAMSVSRNEVLIDIDNLNKGNGLFNYSNDFEVLPNGMYKFFNQTMIYENDYYYSYGDNSENAITITKQQALIRLENYIYSYNKYVKDEILESPQSILAELIENNGYYTNNNYYSYDSNTWEVKQKVKSIKSWYKHTQYSAWSYPWFWKISIAILFWLALMVWIFKQMNLRHYIFGFIALCLTPLLAGLLGALTYAAFYSYGNSNEVELIILTLVLVAYIVIGIAFIRGYLQSKLNQTAYVLSMYFHFWLPVLPLFLFGLFYTWKRTTGYYDYQYSNELMGVKPENFIYWACIVLGIASIAFLKPVYAKFRSLPMRK